MSYVTVAIAGVSAFSQYQQGQADKAASYAQANSLEYQGSEELQSSLDTAKIIRRAGAYTRSAANAAYAASGVQVGDGSAQEVTDQITKDTEHDAYQTILSGEKRNNALRAQAELTRIGGRQAASQATMKAFSTVLGGGYQGMTNSGWRTGGPGFSGTQAPAPIVNAKQVY